MQVTLRTDHYLWMLGCLIRRAITSRQLGRTLFRDETKGKVLRNLHRHPAVQRGGDERMRTQQDWYPYDSEADKGPRDASENELAN